MGFGTAEIPTVYRTRQSTLHEMNAALPRPAITPTKNLTTIPFVTNLLRNGISKDNAYGSLPSTSESTTPSTNASEAVAQENPGRIPAAKKRRRLPRKGSLFVASALLAIPFVGATTGCAVGADTGNITGMTVEGYTVPSDWVQAFVAAGGVCDAISIQKLAADAYKETTFNSLDRNNHQVSNANPPALGPMQWQQPTWDDFIRRHPKLGYASDDVWDIGKAVYASAVYDCDNARAYGGSDNAFSIYYSGGITSAGLAYAQDVNAIADTVRIIRSAPQQQPQNHPQNPDNGAKGKLPDVTNLAANVVFPGSNDIEFWQGANVVVQFDKVGARRWEAVGRNFALTSGKPGKDPQGQTVLLIVRPDSATLSVSG